MKSNTPHKFSEIFVCSKRLTSRFCGCNLKFVKGNMSQNFVTCCCEHCGGDVAFDSTGFQSGQTGYMECPHCKAETIVFKPPQALAVYEPKSVEGSTDNFQNQKKTSSVYWITMILCFAMGCVTTIAFISISHSRLKSIISAIAPEKIDPNFRKVGGNSYDIRDADTWNSPLKLLGLNDKGWTKYKIKVDRIYSDMVVCEVNRLTYYPETYTGNLQVQSSDFVENFVVYHFPDAGSLLSGQELPDCLCMRVGNYNSGGNSVIAFDCGTDH